MTSFLEKPQWISGLAVAEYLDDFFTRRGWTILPTTQREERELYLGDRLYWKNQIHYFIEYKSGIQSFYTGNVFLETVSVDTQNVPGWVYTCRADYIFYAALLNGKILTFAPDFLRQEIEGLKHTFRETRTSKNQNNGYNTHGVIIPLTYAEEHLADQVIEVSS